MPDMIKGKIAWKDKVWVVLPDREGHLNDKIITKYLLHVCRDNLMASQERVCVTDHIRHLNARDKL